MSDIRKEKIRLSEIHDVQMIFSTNLTTFPPRAFHPSAIRLGFQPAVFQAEQPGEENPFFTADLINSLRTDVDFVVTQNERMRQLLFVLFGVIAGWKDNERILLAPLGPNELTFNAEDYSARRDRIRERYDIPESAIVILNAGGFWRWTDCNTFLAAFVDFVIENPEVELYFVQPSFTQTTNSYHDTYINEALAKIATLPRQLQNRVITVGSWHEGALALDELLAISDVGLNVNNEGLENWLSHRVRVTNYLGAGLAVISCGGDELDSWGAEMLYRATPGDVDSYKRILQEIAFVPQSLLLKKTSSRKLAEARVNGPQYARLLQKIKNQRTPLKVHPISLFAAAQMHGLIPNVSRRRGAWLRGQGTVYRVFTQNPAVHGFLVAVGIRAVYRKIKRN